MHLRNDFTQETRELFFWNYQCFWCGQNGWDAIHHILGRESNSPLNASPIHNFKCHIGNGKLNTFDMQSMLLQRTLAYLLEQNYELTEDDLKFKEKNKKYYEKDQNSYGLGWF